MRYYPDSIDGYRELAVHLCEYACDGSKGRPEKGDAVYGSITEWRDSGPHYSSCADLAHWMLCRLGVRLSFINRQEHLGFVVGVNVARLAWNQISDAANVSDRYDSGDVLIIWSAPDSSDAHVCVVINDEVDHILLANYGAPGGKLTRSACTAGKYLRKIGSREIHRVLRLSRVIELAKDRGLLVQAEDPTRGSDGELLWQPS